MSPYYRKRRPEIGDTLAAAAVAAGVAAGVAAVTYYFARILILREPLGPPGEDRDAPPSGEEARRDP